ncbi:PRA1 family protein F2-like [Actinidia eriantha]|uniref:PRA1 family protein F2-like n=1 Tax=Actinidia eriantha TaxID=165200 RepID=UPI002586257C|nr:PRA1 family protein F2-like [Actinidia eriantha]
MTTYGTIPTSSSGGGTNFEYISRAKANLKSGFGSRRPWKEMFNFRSIGFPAGFRGAIGRIRTNLGYFRVNYAIIMLLIVFLSLLWHPISLIVFVVMMAVWLFLYFLRDEPLVIFGRRIDDRVVLIVLSVLTIVFLLLTRATSNILFSLLIGVVIVLIHAALRNTDDLCLDQESTGTAVRFADVASSSS